MCTILAQCKIIHYLCTRNSTPGDVCTSSAEGSRHNKRRLLRSVLTLRNVAVPKYLQDLATIDALRDIDYPSRAYLVRHLRIYYAHAYLNYDIAREYILYSAWASRCQF